MQEGAPIDLSTVLSLLCSISPTFTKVDHTSEDALEFIGAVNQFVYSKDSGIGHKISKLPQSQIKDLKEGEIIAVQRAYYDLSESQMPKEAFLVKSELEMLLIFLQSPYIEKKLTALNEVK